MARTLINFAFVLLLLALIAIALGPFIPRDISDFPLYYEAAQRFCAGKGVDVYSFNPQLGKAGLGLNEPPIFLWAVAPLGLLPYAPAKFVFDSVMAILVSISALILAKSAKLNNRQTIWLLGLVAASGPVFEIIKVSKPSPLLFLGITLSLSCLQKGQDIRAGAWIALCLLKPQEILPFLAFALGAGRIRLLAGCAAVVLLLAAITFPIFGVQGYANFLSRIQYVNAHTEFAGTDQMPILAGQFIRLSVLPAALTTQVCNAIYALALLCLLIFGRTQRRVGHWWMSGTLVAMVSMACIFPYMYAYDLVIIFPGTCYLIQFLAQQKRKALLVCTLIAVAMFMDPIYGFIHYSPICRLDLHFCALAMLSVAAILTTIRIKDGINENAI